VEKLVVCATNHVKHNFSYLEANVEGALAARVELVVPGADPKESRRVNLLHLQQLEQHIIRGRDLERRQQPATSEAG